MQVTSIDNTELAGNLVELAVTWSQRPQLRGQPVSFNQGNHLRGQIQHSSSVWLAGTASLPGPNVGPADVALAVTRLLREHDALRARFTPGEPPTQDVFAADQLKITVIEHGRVDHSEVAALLDTRCRPGDIPGLFFGVLDDTLICAFDHAHADALTIDLVLRRLTDLCVDPTIPEQLGASYARRCRTEQSLCESPGPQTVPQLAIWHEFFGATDGALPAFPLPLGPGRAPQRTIVTHLFDDSADDPFAEPAVADLPFARILTDLAAAVATMGGPDRFATLIPVHTRGPRQSQWHRTAGWLVSNSPVLVAADDVDVADRWLRRAVGLADLPLETVLAQCQPRPTTEDIFMVSYLDYRKLGPPLANARHISAVSTTDTAQLWFSRTHSGLDLRIRYPARDDADLVIGGLLAEFTRRLTATATSTLQVTASGHAPARAI